MSAAEPQAKLPPKKRSLAKRLVFAAIATAVFLVIAVLCDRIIGAVSPALPSSLLFPSGSSVRHKSNEFDVSVAISDAGIRDQEYAPGTPPAGTHRIVTVGDSFTFGWGVETQDAWPNIVERTLSDTSTCEVLNFGFPGSSPYDYEGTARKALQHFRPHVLIIGTLQGDDLIQLHEGQRQEKPLSKVVTQTLFPNFSRVIRGKVQRDPMKSYQETFRMAAQYAISTFSFEEKTRYTATASNVRDAFENGLLNPSLLQRAVKVPEHFLLPCEAEGTWRTTVTERLRDSLQRVRTACDSYDCRLVVAVIPDGPYVSPASGKGLQQVGYTISPDLLQTNVPDSIVMEVCKELGVPCLVQTAEFRTESKTTNYYFSMDGHFNENGHQAFAGRLSAFLKSDMVEATE
jgi:lysophospholipase L1-like esterase